jgi:Pyridoxamine 5'-phosphate oxidase
MAVTSRALLPGSVRPRCGSGPTGVLASLIGVARSAGVAEWRGLEDGAPEIARLGRARLAAVPVAMLGTLRPDGSPRISPVEPCLAGGQLLIGAMARSRKAADLRRDPRYVLHSMVTGADTGEGELKLHGSAFPAGPRELSAADPAWWSGQPPELAAVFTLRIATAIFVEWDLKQAMMTVHRWAPQDGYHRGARRYP